MKASEIRDLSTEEMRRKVKDFKEELFNLRFQHENNQLENPRKLMQTRRNIARTETIIKERERETEE